MSEKTQEKYDLVVIGAGWYGLITAYYYLQLAPGTRMLIVDDGPTVGGVWNKDRIYPNLFTQIGHGLFEYTFYPMRKEGLSPDRYISGETVHGYLYNFAKDMDLMKYCRLDTTIEKVDALGLEPNSGWRLTAKGDPTPILTDKLVVASGVSSGPYIPKYNIQNFDKPIVHSSYVGRNRDKLQGPDVQKVVVLGAAKSAYDTVYMLLKAGKQVDWVIRADGSGPLAIMPPRMFFGLFNTVDVMATRMLASFSPAICNTSGFWYNFLQHSRPGLALTKIFWRTVTWIAENHADYGKSENARQLRPLPYGMGLFYANAGLGCASVPNFWKVFHAGDVTVHRDEIKEFVDGNVILKHSGKVIPNDATVLCTGWTDNLGPFSGELRAHVGLPSDKDHSPAWKKLDEDADKSVNEKLPFLAVTPETPTSKSMNGHRPWRLYRRMISPELSQKGDRSILFPGQVHSVFTPLVAELQALWGVAYLLGKLDLPSEQEMKVEVAEWCAWTRKRYLEQGKRHAYSIYDYLAYVDALAKDLGLNTRRKSNPFTEMLTSYRPSDWQGILGEFVRIEKLKSYEGKRLIAGGDKFASAKSSIALKGGSTYAMLAMLSAVMMVSFLFVLM